MLSAQARHRARGRFFVRPEDVPPYSPANHTGTVNRRVICQETVGAERMEVLIGTIEPGQGALPHAHPDMEQACYVMEGRALVEVGGQKREIGAGEFCFFPAGEQHTVTVRGDAPLRLMVIYSPPYGEDASKVVRGGEEV